MIVTIDGPAAAGKSTAARMLAERLGFDYLDTGAMYRAVTLAALRRRVSVDDECELEKLARSVEIAICGRSVFLDGEEVTEAIRHVDVTRAIHRVADSPAVRHRMVLLQRQAGSTRDIVTEGRDQGTVVFPDAACKFFLTARPEIRAERRQRELLERGQPSALVEVLAEQAQRDDRDANRAIAPMVAAPDAVVLDSSGMSLEQVVETMARRVRAVQTKLRTT